jgi:O-antigen/teichoic acid export membrane protein
VSAAEPASGAEERSLGQQVKAGLGWSLLNTLVGRIGTMLVGIILARLLTPEDYGVFAVALVALNGLLSMNELGVSLAIVRWPGDLDKIAPTVTTLALAGSAGLYGICFVAAPWLSSAMGAPAAAPVLRLLCASVIIDGLTSVPAAMLARTFRQGRRLAGDFASFGISTAVTVLLAVNGTGAWSLAWGRLAGNAVSAILFFALSPARWRPGFDRSEARRLLAFGLPLAGSSLLVFTMLNVDYVVVGSTLGPVALGFYLLAFNLSSWPVNVFSAAVRRVSLAGFSRLTGDMDRLRSSFGRSLSLLMAVTVPVCALLGVLAVPVVHLVYGERWASAAEALRFLAILAVARVAAELAYDLLVALGRSRATLWLQGLWTLALIPVLEVGARLDGIRGVAAGHALVAMLLVLPAFALTLRRAGFSPAELAAGLLRPLAGGTLVAGCALLVLFLVHQPFAVLALAGILALGAYALVIAPMRHLLRAQPT